MNQLTLSFYDDAAIKTMTDSEIIADIARKVGPHEAETMPLAVAAIERALISSAQIGQLLEAIRDRHSGTSWPEVFAKLNLPISQSTADRYRQQWLNKDRVFFADAPTPLALTKAYRDAELLPQPEPAEKSDLPPPPFRLTFSVLDKPVEQWGREYVVDFLTRTERVEQLRKDAKEFIAKGGS
jgi:hypothetical protein